jgi:hypothetical protein
VFVTIEGPVFAIGPSLREARSRRGLSPGDVQQAIRIRERYLTAIEEEHWELLPGDAYTKGFLRTYAEFLGLDGNLYVDEFNARYAHRDEERFVPSPLAPVASPGVGLLRPLLAIGAIVAAIAAVAAWQLRGNGGTGTGGKATAAAPPAATTGSQPTAKPTKPATRPTTVAATPASAPRRAFLSATRGRVWLLVRAGGASGKVLFEGILDQGKTLPVSLAQSVWVRVGAPWNLDVRLGGRVVGGLPAHPGNVLLTAHGLTPAA